MNLSEIDDIIKEYKEKSRDAVTELEGLLTEEKIAENINKRNISTRKEYYVDLYNTIMTSDSMKKQYNVIEEKVKEEKDKLTGKFMKENSYLDEFGTTSSGGKLALYVLKQSLKDGNIKVLFRFPFDMGARFLGMKAGKK